MLADMIPLTLADAKELMQVFGWPGLFAIFFYFRMWPAFQTHLESVNAFLDVAKARAISTDDNLREIKIGVAVVAKKVVHQDFLPEWINKGPVV